MENPGLFDDNLCSSGCPTPGTEFGLLCGKCSAHAGNHCALAEVWPGGRRYVRWTPTAVRLPDVVQER